MKVYYAAENAYGTRTLAPICLHVFTSLKDRESWIASERVCGVPERESITASEARHALTQGGCGVVNVTIHSVRGAFGRYGNRGMLAPDWLRKAMRDAFWHVIDECNECVCYSV